jgi:site-specific recombinase XerD
MTTITLHFRASTVAGKDGTLYYQLIHRRLTRQITTGYRLAASRWDDTRQQIDDNVLHRKTQYEMMRLRHIAERLEREQTNYRTDDIVREFLDERPRHSLFYYMQTVIAHKRQLGRIKTADGYLCALHSFQRFRANENILLYEMTSPLMEAYQAWLQGNGIVPNTISFYLRKLRATYRCAVEEGLIADQHPFRHVFTGTERTQKRALSLSTLRRLKTEDLTRHPRMALARDIFLLSFYLRGMSFIDMVFLKETDLQEGTISYRRHKTGQRLQIEWTEEMQDIVDRYPFNESPYLLPLLYQADGNERNAYLNMAHLINYHLRRLGQRLHLSLPLTLYCARHSWATVARDKGVTISVISEGLGHNSERATRIYLASIDSSRINQVNKMIIQSL